MSPVLAAWPYDLVLGSLHWVGDQIVFDEGYFRARGPHDSFACYFTELERLARFGGFDVLAHPDVVKRVGHGEVGGFDIGQWEDLVRPVWRACIGWHRPEINTGSLRTGMSEVHPGPGRCAGTARWAADTTIGSDGHRPVMWAGAGRGPGRGAGGGLPRLARFENRRVTGWIPI